MNSYDLRDEVLSRTDIVDVVGEVVHLKKRGANFIGLCPFHNEKTPSFTVSQEKQIFKCFGCGKSGNVFTFMQEVNAMSFKEVLFALADKLGIPYENVSPQQSREYDKKEFALKALDFASSYYNSLLLDEEGENARKYLHARGYTDEIIEKFQLGYSSTKWSGLTDYLQSINLGKSALEDAGLISSKTDSDRFWDRFRGRLMFPIKNQIGKVIGFGARDLSGKKDEAKYLNSPQTIIYDKSTAVYGIFNAKNDIRTKEYAIICEGYADVISLHLAGFTNAVASCGTALTKGQLINIQRYTKKIYISYDSDAAGINATAKALEIALPMGFDVQIIKLPSGEDPDSIIQKGGAQVYSKFLSNALGFVDFLFQLASENSKLNTPAEKSIFIKDCLRLIYSIPDNLQHDFYISRLASLMSLSENQIRNIYKRKDNIVDELQREEDKTAKFENTQEFEEQSEAMELLREENLLFEQIIEDRKSYYYCKNNLGLTSNFFFTDVAKKIFDMLEIIYEKYTNFAHLFDSECEELDKDALAFIIDKNFKQAPTSQKWKDFGASEIVINKEKIINDCLLSIELHKLDVQIELFKNEANAIDETAKLMMINDLIHEKIKFKEAVSNNKIEYLIEKYKNK